MRRTLLLAAWLASSCEDVRPCSACPPLEGTYQLQYEGGQLSNLCERLGILDQPEQLQLVQVGSSINARVNGLELRGNVYDTFDFSLSGSGATDGGITQLHIRGSYLPPSSLTDGGTLIRGSLSGTHQRSMGTEGSGTCSTDRPFVGVKQ